MREILTYQTRQGHAMIAVVSRLLFAVYFFVGTFFVVRPPTVASELNLVWLTYLLVIYLVVEKMYTFFRRRQIDMTFAWPLMLAVYSLNMVSLLLGGQDAFPQLNRVEHLASFVLLTYVVSVFFNEYLPQNVWRDHPYYTSLLVLAVTALGGVGNELVELLSDGLFDTHLVGQEYDTSLDLLMNTLGSGLLISVRLIVPDLKLIALSKRSRHHSLR